MSELNPEDMTEKELLRAIGAELSYTNHLLEQLVGVEEEPAEPVYECTMCQREVRESDRQKHMEQEHKAWPGMDLSDHFEKVGE